MKVLNEETLQEHIDEIEKRLADTDGPWRQEGHRVEFKHFGFDCLMQRNTMGAWCGYVALPRDHKWFGTNYNDIDADAHGGLTYSDYCNGVICHEGKETVWWIGFDCGHADDVVPVMEKLTSGLAFSRFADRMGLKGTYKDALWVRGQVERLAEQAAREYGAGS